jgi:hypothetical protein
MSVALPSIRSVVSAPVRPFEPGTTGWTASDLDDPEIEPCWARGSYEIFGVPNYWILDAFAKSLECYRLDGTEYRLDAMGKDQETIQPSVFAGLSVSVGKLWQQAKAE